MLVLIALWACASEPLPVPEPEPEQLRPVLPPPPEPPPRNIPPTIDALTLFPEVIHTGVSARVGVEASDPDGRRPSARYRWKVNDRRVVEAAGDTLSHQHYQKGDEVTVLVTVSDGTDQQEQALSFTVQNSSPTFLTDPRSLEQLDGFQVKSTDPDGDEVTYRLEGAPPGMSISRSSGTIRYVGSVDDPGGDYDIQIIAEDDSGGSATWSFSINVQAGSGAEAP